MQRVELSRLAPGMISACDIYNSDGKLLLASDAVLTGFIIARIREMGISVVYIKTSPAALPVPELLCEQTRVRAMRMVREGMESLAREKKIDLSRLSATAVRIISEVLASKDVMIHLTDIRTHHDFTFGHSVNVCVLSVLVGCILGYNELRLKELALGALLHDVGKVFLPHYLLNKTSVKDSANDSLLKRHPELGYSVLRQQRAFPLLALHVAYQHHERFDGRGYPRKVSGLDIHEYARIAAIADTYDLMTSANENAVGLTPYEAHAAMMREAGGWFDASLLKLFLNHVAVYPVGSMVELNNGDSAVVIQTLPGQQLKPKVRIVADYLGNNCEQREVDLSLNELITIKRLLGCEEIMRLRQTEG